MFRLGMGALVLALLVPLAGVGAQGGGVPSGLIVGADDSSEPNHGRDLYRWNEGANQLERLSEDGLKNTFTLSPDGSRIAYRTAPPVLREALTTGHGQMGEIWDIEVFDVATGARLPVASQAENTILDESGIHNGLNRSALAWSPDSTMLAWTEQDYSVAGEADRRLVMVDLAQGTTRVLDDALPALWMSDDGLPFQVAWGRSGIVVFTNQPDGDYAGILRWYDPQQGLLGTINLGALLSPSSSAEDRGEPPTAGPLWVQDGAAELLILQLGGMWFQVDPQAGTMESFWGTVEQVSAIQPDQSLRVVWVPTNASNLDFQWEIWSPAGESLYTSGASNFGAALNIAMAPTGDAVAFMPEAQSVVIWRTDGVTPVETGSLEYLTLLWGPTLWRVSGITLTPGFG